MTSSLRVWVLLCCALLNPDAGLISGRGAEDPPVISGQIVQEIEPACSEAERGKDSDGDRGVQICAPFYFLHKSTERNALGVERDIGLTVVLLHSLRQQDNLPILATPGGTPPESPGATGTHGEQDQPAKRLRDQRACIPGSHGPRSLHVRLPAL
jgi:hypothetical protein